MRVVESIDEEPTVLAQGLLPYALFRFEPRLCVKEERLPILYVSVYILGDCSSDRVLLHQQFDNG